MLIQHTPPFHLSYCLNIHRGESWEENYAAIAEKAAAVAAQVPHKDDFGLGLRLSAQAAAHLVANPAAQCEAVELFAQKRLYPFSVNAFPYGRFHAGRVKEQVYAPDWRTQERVTYTNQVAGILAGWLPDGVEGSISTVPGSYKAWIKSDADLQLMATNLAAVVKHLVALRNETGRLIHLGLEPEPDCFLETTAETIHFFKEVVFTHGVSALSSALGCSNAEAEAQMRRHLGVCFDTCHTALQYEDPLEALLAYAAEGILISKVQLSAALRLDSKPEGWKALRAFNEAVYLHQVKGRDGQGSIHSWSDLDVALADEPGLAKMEELRCHFHVPLFFEANGPLRSTASTLTPAFFAALKSATTHAEIETYTFDVFPAELHPGDIVQSITREFEWVLKRI